MYQVPDYEIAREQAGFSWSVSDGQNALRHVTNTPIREFNLVPEATIEAYRKGRPILREMFGPDVAHTAIYTPHISYGHVNGLGSKLVFPKGGEVAHTHVCDSLDDAIALLEQSKGIDWSQQGMAQFWVDYLEKMQAAFPDEPVGTGYGLEGPLTTAYELRGDGFFVDILDRPDDCAEFLRLLTESINEFDRFRQSMTGATLPNPNSGGLCDDIASVVPPRLWPKLVLPFWHMRFEAATTGTLWAHAEDLRPQQVHFLDDAGLTYYDPSISPKINPKIIARECRVPFGWRLGTFHFYTMDLQDIQDFVYQSVADGASKVFTFVAGDLCNADGVAQVHAFIDAAKNAETFLAQGCSRAEIGERVSERGRARFWDNWEDPSYKG